MKYFLRRHGAYFRPDGGGYTNDITEAGVYADDDPHGYVRGAKRGSIEGLTLVPAELVAPYLRAARDRMTAKLAELGESEDGPTTAIDAVLCQLGEARFEPVEARS